MSLPHARIHPVHQLRPMVGRDPDDAHRAATPLELLYDLVFVISFGFAASELAHLVAEGYWGDAVLGFSFAMFGVIWAWINFTWFASAFDNDDWLYRVLVMVQMVGVVVLALGLREVFGSIHAGGDFDNRVVIAGYVTMRVPLIALWVRVALSDPAHKRSATIYATVLAIVQVAWCLSLLVHVSFVTYVLLVAPLFVFELIGPIIAESRGEGTPWHPHHIAERYGLLAIIALGEVLIGTVAALETLIEAEGWTTNAAALVFGGVALTFGLWWTYFNLPAANLLEQNRSKAWVWGYGHLVVYSAIAAVGAGLHVIALFLEHHAEVSRAGAVASTAIPAAIYFVALTLLAIYLLNSRVWVVRGLAAVLALLALSVFVVYAGASILVGMLVLTIAPWVGVVVQEFYAARPGQTITEL